MHVCCSGRLCRQVRLMTNFAIPDGVTNIVIDDIIHIRPPTPNNYMCIRAGKFAMAQVPVIRQILSPLSPLIQLYFGFPFS